MSRNDLINALIRVFGVVVVVGALIGLFEFLESLIRDLYVFISILMDSGFKPAWAIFPLGSLIGTFLLNIFILFLGMYLMKGGPWFSKKATQN